MKNDLKLGFSNSSGHNAYFQIAGVLRDKIISDILSTTVSAYRILGFCPVDVKTNMRRCDKR